MKNPEKGLNVPDDLKYKDNHQWLKMRNNRFCPEQSWRDHFC